MILRTVGVQVCYASSGPEVGVYTGFTLHYCEVLPSATPGSAGLLRI